MYDIIEGTVNGQKVNSDDIVVKWREWDGNEHSGGIESYAYAVAECDEFGNIIKTYHSCHSAAKSNGLIHQVINECVTGKRKSAYGVFIWKMIQPLMPQI